MYATLSSKGRIAVPVAMRTLFDWRTGDAIDFVGYEETSRVKLVAKRNPVTVLKGLIGKPKKTVTQEEMDAAIGVGADRVCLGYEYHCPLCCVG